VASTKELAHRLTTASTTPRPASDSARVVNADVLLQFKSLADILTDNRGQLVAQNMLSEGRSKEEAEKKIDELLELTGWFDHLAVSLDSTPTELRITADLELQPKN
jgi:hypothetical protein